jgi:hypothetical protein
MKQSLMIGILVGAAMLFSTQAFAQSAMEDLQGVAADPAYYDGGDGSTLNE